MNNSGIYGIFYKNECVYIGQAVNIRKRYGIHKSHLKNGIHASKYLQRIVNKHGFGALDFDIIDLCEIEDLTCMEQFWITSVNPKANTFKVCVDSAKGVKRTNETKLAISKAKSHQVLCIETGEIFESANKASLSLGRSRTAVGMAIAARAPCAGLHFRYLNRPEFSFRTDSVRIPILCVSDNKWYPSLRACAKAYNISPETLREAVLAGRPVKGYTFTITGVWRA